MANRYWVGGAGNWSDTARWSTTSGGASGASVPGAADTAIFNASSDSGVNYAATVNSTITIASLELSNEFDLTIGTAENLTVSTSTVVTMKNSTYSAIISGNTTLGAVTHTTGTLDIGGNTVTMTSYTATSGTRKLAFGTNGTINVTGNNATVWAITVTGTSIITGTGTVNLTYSGGVGTRTIDHDPGAGTTLASFKVSAGTDIVVFSTNNSFNALDFTGFSGTWTNNAITLAGSLTVSSGMTVSAGTGTLTMDSTGSRNITSNGKTLDFPLTITGTGGTVTLQDALTIGSTRTLTFTRGTFNANNNNVTTGLFASNNSNTRTLTMGSGTWTLSGVGSVWNLATVTALTFNKDTANILLSDTTITARTFAGGGLTYNNLTIGGATGISTLTFTGSNTFGTIASTKTVAHTITLPASGTTTVANWTATGRSGNVLTINSSTAATQSTLTKTGGGVISGLDYLSIQDSNATPSLTWYAGANSTNTSNNTGWIFTAAPSNGNFFFLFN